MNFLLISPAFPDNFKPFAYALKKKGVNVLGLGDTPYHELGTKLQEALTEYYFVPDMDNMDEVKKGVAYLYDKHGGIDRIESHNEYWLELDAKLREEFNVPGVKPAELKKTKYKSEMKKIFQKAGVPVVEGLVVQSKNDIKEAAQTLDLPVVAKPDMGVGSAATYRLKNEEDLQDFIRNYDESVPYFMEQAINSSRLGTYDGLIDQQGNIVFETSLVYSRPTLEYIEDGADMAYVITKEMDPKLIEYGRASVKAFGMKERFFHIEFFKMSDGDYIALEYNNRIAGNFAVDMYNYAHSIDLFSEYANIVLGRPFEGNNKVDNQFCVGVTQRDLYQYSHERNDIYNKYGDQIKLNERVPEAFSELLGNNFYAINTDIKQEVDEIIDYVHARKN